MPYVDFVYYSGTYSGTLGETEFNKYEPKAELYLNRETFNNITTETAITDTIKSCICEIVDIIYDKSTYANNKNIVSENNDGYSVSYQKNTDVEADFNRKIRETVVLYLDNPDDCILLYRGV